ncbi:nucleolar pre-ribosomal-associated protein 1 domain-containing protein [Hirsutella rhossiliensis]
MGKRASIGADGAAAYRKRQKIVHDAPAGEDVLSGDHLHQLIAFNQDLRQARHGLQSFKKLLDDALADNGDRKAKLAILQQYLDMVRPRDTGEDAIFLQDIMDTWSFAIQVNDDGVMSSVAVVLALLLRVVSDSLQLVPHGLGVCQTLLQERQLKSLSRNLSSEKGKGFIISPTLRLLREAVCLDGGAYAKRIVRARAHTFAYLSRNLELGHSGEGQEDSRKSSVRTHAVRFLLSCLKYLHSEGRKELLLQKELFSHLTYSIKSDPDYLILEILDALKLHVLMDSRIPREVKSRSFNIKTLLRFLALYTHMGSSEGTDEKDSISERAHQFLKYVCTTPGAGVLYPYKGLYPKESSDERSSHMPKRQGESRGGDAHDSRFDKGVPVFNFVLSEFAEKLRPWSSLKHSELLVAMFTAAPELISNYFYHNRSFTFEPKLSMTWIGYAAFLFDTISLPLSASFGDPVRFADSPPPTTVLLDNIIPPAINQKVLVRCLSPKSHLTSFFATRIIVAALEKLTIALRMHKSTSSRNRGSKWSEAARRLVDAFCQRIPDMKEVVRCYKDIPAENSLHKTLAGRLLHLYYNVIPQVALAAKFDVSPLFVHVLKGLHQNEYEPGIKALSIMELESLVSIASYSPGMRWFSKIEGLGGETSFSAFTALVHLLCCGDRDTPYRHLKNALADVAVENQLVSSASGLRPLLGALRCVVDQFGSGGVGAVWGFLDNCISRCAASPIKYLDQMESRTAEMKLESANPLSSLLTLAFVEQLPYATTSGEEKDIYSLTRFLSLYFNACHLWEGGHLLLNTLHQDVDHHLTSNKAKLACLGDADDVEALKTAEPSIDGDEVASWAVSGDHSALSESSLQEMLHAPCLDGGDTAVLTKWNSKSAEDLVDDGWAVGLVRLLLSEHTNIRKEALTSILKVAARVKDSSHEEKTQIWLLLSELAESSKAQVESGPVPSAFVAFTMHALDVLRSPLHPLYRKVNSFLTRSPVWSLEKLPLAHDILHGEPSEDDKYYSELAWLLGYLLDSLRTASDLSVFHKKKWLEKIFALGSNPYLRSGLRTRVLRIVYRATFIEAGSTTLVTRFGVLGWLDAQRASCEATGEAAAYEGLMRRVWETCDQERVTAWSNGGMEELVARAVGRRAASL